MAHSTNRSIDFAPAWLKLPETNQDVSLDLKTFICNVLLICNLSAQVTDSRLTAQSTIYHVIFNGLLQKS